MVVNWNKIYLWTLLYMFYVYVLDLHSIILILLGYNIFFNILYSI